MIDEAVRAGLRIHLARKVRGTILAQYDRPGGKPWECWLGSLRCLAFASLRRFSQRSLQPTTEGASRGAAKELSRLLRLQPALPDRLLTHHELLDLAGDGHREFIHELDVARDLVVGDLAYRTWPALLSPSCGVDSIMSPR